MGCGPSKVAPAVQLPSNVAPRSGTNTQARHGSSSPTYEHTAGSKQDLQVLYFNAFIEFPTPHLLRGANQMYTKMNRAPEPAENGSLIPYPVPSSKKDVFNLKSYEAIDKYALEIPASLYQNPIGAFTDYLTKPYRKNSMAMARIIFRWLAAQDINKFDTTTSCAIDTVAWNLQKINESNGHFCDTFVTMCRHVGFQCQIVRGYAKHAQLELGQAPKEEDSNRWIAIEINNEWRLIDPHWGSSKMGGGGSGDWLLIDDDGSGAKHIDQRPDGTAYSYDETYFLTNPEQLIYSHFPTEDASWQLLARPVTLQEFTDMAYLKAAFFEQDLRLLDHRKCILYSTDGEIDIRIGTPPDKPRGFIYRLWMSNKQSIGDVSLDRFCILQQTRGILSCRIYFPAVGKFKIELYVKDAAKNVKGNFVKLACAYIIHVDKASESIKAFPKNNRAEWGPGYDLLKAGLHPVTHHDAMIEADDGVAEVRFRYDKPVEIMHKLRSNDMTAEDLDGSVMHYMDYEKNEVVLKMRLPEAGDYALELYAKEEGKEGSLSNVCNYIMSTVTAATNQSSFPKLVNGRLGSMVKRNAPTLKLLSHKSPIILCPGSGEVDLLFKSSIPCKVTDDLELHVNGQKIIREGYVWTTNAPNNKINFKIIFPEPGKYTLSIFAKDANDDEGTFPLVYTCMINVRLPKSDCAPFPKTYAAFTPDCQLIEPMTGVIPANSRVRFAAVIPNSVKVATISGDAWTYLEKGSDGVWRGEADTGDIGTLALSAQSTGKSTSYSTLVEYKVVENKKLKQEEHRRNQIEQVARIENERTTLWDEAEEKKRQNAFEKAKHDLVNAIESRDLEALRRAVKAVERQKYTNRLHDEVEVGRRLIKSLERIRNLNKSVLDISQTTMLEIRSYTSPPALVHEVIVATLLLLGNTEDTTREWKKCQKQLTTIGKDGLQRRIKAFDVTSIHPEIASRALVKIGKYRLHEVRDVSAGAGTFYTWTAGMIEEIQIYNQGIYAPPANVKRQHEIFSGF